MATKTNSAEVGSNGDAITDGNKLTTTGGTAGDAFDTITISGAPTFEKTTTNPAFGTRAYHVSGGSGTTGYPRWTLNDTQIAFYGHFRYNGLPSTAHTLFQTFGGGVTINLTSSNVMQVLDQTGLISGAFTGAALVTATDYRLEVIIDQHAQTTTSGDITVKLYSKGSGTVVTGYSYVGTGKNTGTANMTHARMFGKQTSAMTLDITFDSLALANATTTLPALPGANAAPVANAGPVIYCDAGTATLHLSGSATDDTAVTTLAWSRVSGPTSPTISTSTSGIGTASATATADVDVSVGHYVFRLTAGDGSLTHTDDVGVYVADAGGTPAAPVAADANDWLASGGAASVLAGVTDGSASTGMITTDNPAGDIQWINLPPLPLGNIFVNLSGNRTASTAITRTVALYKEDKTTLIDSQVQAPGLSYATLTYSLTDATKLATIPARSDRRALWIKITSTV